MKKYKRAIRLVKRLLYSRFFRATFVFTRYYDKNKKLKNEILFQSYDGSSISGNVYYMLEEIYKDHFYDQYKKYIVCDPKEYATIKRFLHNKNMVRSIKLVKIHSRKYCKLLTRAKYLINNSTFPSYFIKKDGQVYVNTWHGTPLKAMGRNIKNSPNELGNTQRNFMMADYLLYQNEFMFEKMKKDYMLDNFFKGKYVLSGYPRNDAFYNNASRENIKEKLEVSDKKIVVYMPTWRGSLVNKDNLIQYHYIMYLLLELDNKTDNDTVIYVKLHNYANSMINYDQFKHIREFPKGYETYEFLNIADVLVTDYSSVFFDYANTKRKIVLFAYDKKEYLKDRGMYLEYDQLPFKIVENISDLSAELKNINDYEEYEEFYNQFCNYDSPNTAKKICDYLFKGVTDQSIKVIEGEKFANNKENVLIFGGALLKNGITTALKGIFQNIDLTKRNYILTFYKSKVEKNKKEINFFKNVDYIPIQGRRNATFSEYIASGLYFYFKTNAKPILNKINKMYHREIKRIYPNLKFDYVIHFSGYEKSIMHLFKLMDAQKMIYVHNDLVKEEKTKGNFHKNSLIEAYEKFDKIVLVRESQIQTTKQYLGKTTNLDKIKVAHNFNNIELILKNTDKPICLEDETFLNVDLNRLIQILEDKNSIKFINIARFSKEKGIDRLVRAFDRFNKQNPNNYLIIIGGYGKQFNEIKELIETIDNEKIVLIKNIRNPYPILNKCDCFILSSYYEGLPMTIMESLILGKKVISTDIEGPREFLQQGYGYLVENSEEGLYNGMKAFVNGELENLRKFDAEDFNNKASQEFEELFN